MTFKTWILAGASTIALTLSTAALAITVPAGGVCKLTDVKQGAGGTTNAVDCIGVLGSQGNNVNDSLALVNSTNVGPSLNGTPTPRFFGGTADWQFGGKQNVGGLDETGVLGAGAVSITGGATTGNGNWTISGLGAWDEFIVILKQANFLGAYLFTNETIGTGTWSVGAWTIQQNNSLSHLSVYVRGSRPSVPEPATLGLLGLGLLGAAAARRRRKA